MARHGDKATLTKREREILLMVWTTGMNNRACAKRLGIAARTIETHTNNMHKKTGTHNVAALLRWGVKAGELSLNGDGKRRTP